MKYSIITTQLYVEENHITSYGISVDDKDQHICVPDISPDKEYVVHMVDLFQREKLAPSQLLEVIEDWLP